MNSLSDWERIINDWTSKRADAVKRHTEELRSIEWEIAEATRQRNLLLDGLDAAKIELADHVIYVRGDYERAGQDRAQCREDAIRELLAGGGRLRTEYCGTKSYDRWHGQWSCHPYGMGPSHGSIIFEIGMQRTVRGRDLTADEIDAAVYYLRNLERIQAASRKESAA